MKIIDFFEEGNVGEQFSDEGFYEIIELVKLLRG
jgi:hypothetical protein